MVAGNDDLQGAIEQLSGEVAHLSQTVFQIGGKHDAFMVDSLNERVRQNDRLTALESSSLSKANMKETLAEALTEHGVVTQDTLGPTIYRQAVGGFRRTVIFLGILSTSIGGMTVLISHLVKWIH